MKTSNDKNKSEINGFSEKPYSKIEPVTPHDAGLTDDKDELYGTPQTDSDNDKSSPKQESNSQDPDENKPDGSEYFEEEEEVVNDEPNEDAVY